MTVTDSNDGHAQLFFFCSKSKANRDGDRHCWMQKKKRSFHAHAGGAAGIDYVGKDTAEQSLQGQLGPSPAAPSAWSQDVFLYRAITVSTTIPISISLLISIPFPRKIKLCLNYPRGTHKENAQSKSKDGSAASTSQRRRGAGGRHSRPTSRKYHKLSSKVNVRAATRIGRSALRVNPAERKQTTFCI
ncbi:hypothetical protein EVAR_2767_1 [Eumeta japonica]|uniref:Uncharacterized protein n=1 Tax=Eumeta variegata TaxID=151549 RepID=A0A4C1SZF8_EUMVA|nr:hypothetical protein EVAR_2767_1 [Eumeta japonica]